ncbi:endonuclease MutS2, partial [candidate division KSB3 bacterium]|nr:endonuclease MutS2 [candidate division KSB3 bacterium]MBD3323709.1 endonuclease MutS2 [candidate division KSB3 bacterium]
LTILGELDFINAKARSSERWDCCQPKLHRKKRFRLRQARHPVLLMQHESDPTQVVPIDVEMDEPYTTVLITGPNTGGKTVSLKTIGVLTLMVQAGMHIPVGKDSELPVFDQVYADIGDQQSIEQNLSTFSSHVSHIVEILKQVNARSLVLLDELGAGTDPAEGASLGIAILEHLDRVKATCIATTHHDALKSYAYMHERTLNACVEFDVNTLSPTYHLMVGLPGQSNALIIAERLGVPPQIIQRAREVIGEDLLQVDHLIRKLTTDSEEIRRKKQEIDDRYRGVLRLEKETDRLLELAEQERQDILDNALEEAKQIVDQALKNSQNVLRKLPKTTRHEGKQMLKPLHQEAAAVRQKLHQGKRQHTTLPELETAPEDIAPGGKVRLAGLEQTGTVLSISKDGQQAEVQVGAMKIEMAVNQLAPIKSAKSASTSPKVSVSDHSASLDDDRSIPQELVIIGKRVDDALDEVETYLDQAFRIGLSSVSIVHGMGTGTLKKAVAERLRTHPHVVSYAVDEHNYGMTNVELARK